MIKPMTIEQENRLKWIKEYIDTHTCSVELARYHYNKTFVKGFNKRKSDYNKKWYRQNMLATKPMIKPMTIEDTYIDIDINDGNWYKNIKKNICNGYSTSVLKPELNNKFWETMLKNLIPDEKYDLYLNSN